MPRIKGNTEIFALLIILIIGGILRFYNYSDWSLSNDELSALTRLNFNSFHEMIEKGVRVDYHPAGVEVFLFYWVKIFGDSEASVRLPFVLAGILSILFAYLISERWFNRTTALFVALSLSCLQFPILYSQLARPYSPGLLFSLSTVYFWTLLLFPSAKKRNQKSSNSNKIIAGFVLSASACMYTHYFAFMFAGIVCLTGLFFLNRDNFKAYIISGILIVLLYIPHIGILRQQLSYGGVGSWLGKPTSDFFKTYIEYGLNNSDLIFYLFWGICIISFVVFRKTLQLSVFHLITIIWFMLPFAIGYYYSVHINPVLQFSTLLFSFPFLLMFIFSFFPDIYGDVRAVILLAFMGVVCIYSTVVGNEFYTTNHFGVFKELAQKTIKWDEQYGEKNITRAIDLCHPNYIKYYFKKFNVKPDFAIYQTGNPEQVAQLKAIVDTSKTQYFIYGWSNIYSSPDINEIIRSKYPDVIERDSFTNSEITLYARHIVSEPERKASFSLTYDFEEIKPTGKDSTLVSTEQAHSGINSLKLDNNTEYSPGITEKMTKLSHTGDGVLDASVWVYVPDTNSQASLVITFESDGKAIDWSSVAIKNYAKQPNKWVQVFASRKIPKSKTKEDVVKVYIWNQDKKVLYFDDLEVKVY